MPAHVGTEVRLRGHRMLDSGKNLRAVARALGVTRATVEYWKRTRVDWEQRQRQAQRAARREAAKKREVERMEQVRVNLREVVQRSREGRSAICVRIGLSSKDTRQLERLLGESKPVARLTEDRVVAILRAIHLDPVDIGL